MSHNFQFNRLLELQKSYKAFLPFCPSDKLASFTLELQKLELRINKINSLTVAEAVKEVPYYFETKQSKANFIN